MKDISNFYYDENGYVTRNYEALDVIKELQTNRKKRYVSLYSSLIGIYLLNTALGRSETTDFPCAISLFIILSLYGYALSSYREELSVSTLSYELDDLKKYLSDLDIDTNIYSFKDGVTVKKKDHNDIYFIDNKEKLRCLREYLNERKLFLLEDDELDYSDKKVKKLIEKR